MAKRHFRKIDRKCQISCVTSPKAQYVYNQSMAGNENSTSSYVELNNDLFLYAFVDCSTDIEVVITELLEHMVVRKSLPIIYAEV